jgi:Transglutaminase-like superfamily
MQSRLRKFIKLPAADRWLLASAIVSVIKARATVMFVPVRTILQPLPRGLEAVSADNAAARISWAVETAGRIVPTGENCLVKAIAGREMLACRGISSEIRIGVAKNSPDTLSSHAWLECGDRIVTGEGAHLGYIAMPVGERRAESSRLATTPSSFDNP